VGPACADGRGAAADDNEASPATRVEIEPDPRNRLDTTSYARCEDIRAVSEYRLEPLFGRVNVLVMTAVEQTMRRFFGG